MSPNSEKIIGIVQHLANLTFIFDAHEKLGTNKSPILLWEWEQAEKALQEAITEKQNARKSGQEQRGNDKARTEGSSNQSRRG